MKSNDWHEGWQIDWSQDHYGVLAKLLFYASSARTTEGILRTLGFVHLYTASGIHLYALLDALDRVSEKLASIFGVRALWMKRAALILGLIVLAKLWALQAYRIGFARPVLIFLLRFWARARGTKWRVFYPLAITIALDALYGWITGHPLPGRWHYDLAVGGGLLGLEWARQMRGQRWSLLREHVAMAAGSWIFTAWIDLWANHQVAWMTPIWSLITIPLISWVLYPVTVLFLLTTHSIPGLVFSAWNTLIATGVAIADQGFTFSCVSPSAVTAALILAGIVTVFLHRVQSRRKVALLLFTLFGLTSVVRFRDEILVQLDVGQGDAMLIQKAGRIEMIDVGSARALRPEAWLQRLSRYGINHVDTVLLSHLDEDHAGGLKNLAAWVPIGAVETNAQNWKSAKGKALIASLRARNPKLRFTSKNELKLMQVAWFRSTTGKEDGNGLMSGVVVPLDGHRVYLALGDGDVSQEEQYVRHFSRFLSSDPIRIWKVSHHGSKFSSGWAPLRTLHPSKAWISVGRHNPYHHPTIEALDRLRRLRIPIYRTDEEGDLVEKISQPFSLMTS